MEDPYARDAPLSSGSLCLTTDYQSATGCPEPSLRVIAEAGFTHVHWCHQWNTDFLYSRPEIEQIARWLSGFGLQLLDLHGSAGREKCWWSTRESERLAGVELVENRLRMIAELGGRTVVMHIPKSPPDALKAEIRPQLDALRRSIDGLLPTIRQLHVRLALEIPEPAKESFLPDAYRAGQRLRELLATASSADGMMIA